MLDGWEISSYAMHVHISTSSSCFEEGKKRKKRKERKKLEIESWMLFLKKEETNNLLSATNSFNHVIHLEEEAPLVSELYPTCG